MIIVYADIVVVIGGLINGIIALILGAGPTAYTSLGYYSIKVHLHMELVIQLNCSIYGI